MEALPSDRIFDDIDSRQEAERGQRRGIRAVPLNASSDKTTGPIASLARGWNWLLNRFGHGYVEINLREGGVPKMYRVYVNSVKKYVDANPHLFFPPESQREAKAPLPPVGAHNVDALLQSLSAQSSWVKINAFYNNLSKRQDLMSYALALAWTSVVPPSSDEERRQFVRALFQRLELAERGDLTDEAVRKIECAFFDEHIGAKEPSLTPLFSKLKEIDIPPMCSMERCEPFIDKELGESFNSRLVALSSYDKRGFLTQFFRRIETLVQTLPEEKKGGISLTKLLQADVEELTRLAALVEGNPLSIEQVD